MLSVAWKTWIVTLQTADITDITATATELNILDWATLTTTELNYVDWVTSNIQTQLNGKQATITGWATTITSANLTASRALVSDWSWKVAVATTTATEIGYLNWVTSAIQTQLNNKVWWNATDNIGYLNIPQNKQNTAYELVIWDAWKHIYHDDATARAYTIPANSSVSFPIWTAITFVNNWSGAVTIAITTDTMYLSWAWTTWSRTLAQYGVATAIKIDTTKWIISWTNLT